MGITPDSDLLLKFILPGAAVSLLVGNLFYASQAHRLARREGRDDVTALPYGINTPSLLVYIFFVMVPVYSRAMAGGVEPEAAARSAWLMGLVACLGSGLIELIGSFFAESIRKHTPRAALLSTLAGIAIGFISMTFALQIYQRPVIAMVPMAIIFMTYFAQVRLPLGLPGGFVAVLVGTTCGWLLPMALPESLSGPPMSATSVAEAWNLRGTYLPAFVGNEVWQLLREPSQWVGYLSVIIPMGLFNVLGSLQNIESAEAAGDRYSARPAMLANALGTIGASLFGSCFPTTIYIGHPGWKEMGARAGYSTLNGLVITLICFTGTVACISRIIPLEAGIAIVLWIGIIITAQAFQTTPKEHAPAAATGLFPAIAAWGATVVMGAFAQARGMAPGARTIQELLQLESMGPLQGITTEVNGFLVHGMLRLERGYIFTCMILSAIAVCLIEREFRKAGLWAVAAAALAFTGLTHAYQLNGNVIDFLFVGMPVSEGAAVFRANDVGIAYLMVAGVFLLTGKLTGRTVEADS